MPAAILSSVVLPEPEGPSRHRTSPGSAASVTSAQRLRLRAIGVADALERQARGEGDAGGDPGLRMRILRVQL